MSPSELMGERLLKLVNKPDAARLQATVIAMACMGVYSPPFGKAIDGDLLILTTAAIESPCFFDKRECWTRREFPKVGWKGES